MVYLLTEQHCIILLIPSVEFDFYYAHGHIQIPWEIHAFKTSLGGFNSPLNASSCSTADMPVSLKVEAALQAQGK